MTGFIGRREFITALGGVTAAWPLAAVAQVLAKRPLIAWLSLGERTASWAFVEAFLQGMRDFGYTDGENFELRPDLLMVTSSGCLCLHKS